MNGRMLTAWSQEYVDAFFTTDRARDPLLGRFKQAYERDAFMVGVKGLAYVRLEVVPLDDGNGIRVSGATPETLLAVIRLVALYGGEILFPGALPG
jgi:hypothetical protein